ncbi:hypothetical protein ACFOHS_00955 [Jhaorihella thermophila]
MAGQVAAVHPEDAADQHGHHEDAQRDKAENRPEDVEDEPDQLALASAGVVRAI